MLSNDVRNEQKRKLENDIFHYPIFTNPKIHNVPAGKMTFLNLCLNLPLSFDLLTFDAESNCKTAQWIKDGFSYSF